MGRASRSFLRYRENVSFLGDVKMMKGESKREIIDFMHRFEQNDRSVYFAENIQTMTPDQLKEEVQQLAQKLEEKGANGVVELHPTGDSTSKSAHIHYWGELTDEINNDIIQHIKERRLSNKTYLNYTNEEMKLGTSHKIVKDELVEYEFDRSDVKNITRTDKREPLKEEAQSIETQAKRDTYYDQIIDYCDSLLEELFLEKDERVVLSTSIDYDSISDYITDLELGIEYD